MKIDGIGIIGGAQEINKVKHTGRKNSVTGEDAVIVSDKAQLFQTLLNKAKQLPNINENRVKELSVEIEKGDFLVDAGKIARNILFQND